MGWGLSLHGLTYPFCDSVCFSTSAIDVCSASGANAFFYRTRVPPVCVRSVNARPFLCQARQLSEHYGNGTCSLVGGTTHSHYYPMAAAAHCPCRLAVRDDDCTGVVWRMAIVLGDFSSAAWHLRNRLGDYSGLAVRWASIVAGITPT